MERVGLVKMGRSSAILMYGPTGVGKSYTVFGSHENPGILYHALTDLLQEPRHRGVNVFAFEIYNEEVYDLMASAGSAAPLGSSCRVRVEVVGRKMKNGVIVSGSDAEKMARKLRQVEKRRAVRSTVLNEQSSRSHCLVNVCVPAVGGSLLFVDMAGSETIDQSGLKLEQRLQTGKINQGNAAMKRVIEALANGDSYIPYRDSKLTMFLHDSDKAPVPRELEGDI